KTLELSASKRRFSHPPLSATVFSPPELRYQTKGSPRDRWSSQEKLSRRALFPAVIPTLAKAGLEVVIEPGAGEAAGYPDHAYTEKGAKILADRAAVFSAADLV